VLQDKEDEAAEILETVRFVKQDHPDINEILDKNGSMGLYDPSSFETMHSFCNAYNKAVEKHIASKKKPAAKLDGFPVRCSRSHLKHVLQKCYNKSISDPNLLNHYEAFTPEVSLFFVTYTDIMMWFDVFF